MTTKYFAETALKLAETWGNHAAPLYAVGATAKDVACFSRAVENPDTVFYASTKWRLHFLGKQALSLPRYTMSEMEAAMSDPTLQMSITWPMLLEAYERKFGNGTTSRVLAQPTKQWIRNLQKRDASNVSQKYPRLCLVFAELHASLSRQNPSPTPAKEGQNAPKSGFLGSGGAGGVVVALLLCLFGQAAMAQQALPFEAGKYTMLHITTTEAGRDTVRYDATVGEWRKAQDVPGGVFCPVLVQGRVAVVRVTPDGSYWNKTPIATQDGHIIVNPSRPDGVKVELIFTPK